jgi:hypothetical protein
MSPRPENAPHGIQRDNQTAGRNNHTEGLQRIRPLPGDGNGKNDRERWNQRGKQSSRTRTEQADGTGENNDRKTTPENPLVDCLFNPRR